MERLGIGMIGYGFMGKTHSIGYRDVPLISGGALPKPRLVALYGRSEEKLEAARDMYGWEKATTDWRAIIDDPEIDLVDNSGPNSLHVEPTLAALAAGKHIYCEKPLGPDANQAYEMWRAAEDANVVHMCAFNYRFFPAIRLAKQMIDAGEIGEIYHYRSQFLVSSSLGTQRRASWRDSKASAGAGALGDLGAHHIDLSRYLLGQDPVALSALTKVVVPTAQDGQAIETDDQFASLISYSGGTMGVIEASRVAGGHLVTSRVEIDGSKGSLAFSMQNLNELLIAGSDKAFRRIPVLRENDPYQTDWFPPGHPLGWVDTFSHEAKHVIGAICGHHDVAPHGATFKDGYYCSEIIDAALLASREQRQIAISYRDI